MGKYDELWKYVSKQEEDMITLTFEQIEGIIGFSMDHSFLNHKKEILEYGYIVQKISLKEKKVIFIKR